MKNKIISISFIGILITVLLLNSILPVKAISNNERRKLSQFPELSVNTVLNGGESVKKDRVFWVTLTKGSQNPTKNI